MITKRFDKVNEYYLKLRKKFREIKLKLNGSQKFYYKTPLNFRFICFPEQSTSRKLYLNLTQKDEVELEIAREWVKEGDKCLDLGANIGYWSIALANQVLRKGKNISIEASPKTVAYLEKSIQALNLEQVSIEPICITNQNGVTEFMVAKEGGSEVKQSLQVNEKVLPFYNKERIATITLNSLLNKYNCPREVSLVKIDIEGAEPLALQGGSLLFEPEYLPLFIVEVYKVGLKRLGFSPQDIIQYFSQDLFEFYQVNRSYPNDNSKFKYGKIYPIPDIENHEWSWLTNLIAVPKTGKFSERKPNLIKYLNQ